MVIPKHPHGCDHSVGVSRELFIAENDSVDDQLSHLSEAASMFEQRTADDHSDYILKRESRIASRLTSGIVALLIVVLIATAIVTSVYARRRDLQQFQQDFQMDASHLIETFYEELADHLFLATSLSATFTATAAQQNTSFLELSVPDFTIQTIAAASPAKFITIAYAPLENISTTNLLESPSTMTEIAKATDIVSNIFVKSSLPSPLYSGPVSQVFPPNEETSNEFEERTFNERRRALRALTETKNATLSELLAMTEQEEQMQSTNKTKDTRTLLVVPVFRSNDDHNELVGSISVEFSWTDLLGGSASSGGDMIAILDNNCNATVMYRISGVKSELIGFGDKRSHRFEDMRVNSTQDGLQQAIMDRNEANTPFYISQEPFGAGCQYTLGIYPSNEYRAKSSDEFRFTAFFSGVFASAIVLFVVYSYIISRRQNRVFDIAVQSSAIVHSLYPASFRDRLFAKSTANEDEVDDPLDTKLDEEHGHTSAGALFPPRLRQYQSQGESSVLARYRSTYKTGNTRGIEPIADLFPHTTVMFADIAGFTAWSSVREPSQVFTLLETLYREFDSIAKRLGVFKVETVGDCYVAAAGLPEANRGHAVIIARFAWECLFAMSRLTKELEIQLGPGTSDLALRVGLHSGSVTAGILRGEKSRFQLFGDTVNTAARMESTGVKKRIQVSEATAGELRIAGKEHWLIPRKELVEAKGKGKLQTYWVVNRRKARKGTSSTVSSYVLEDDMSLITMPKLSRFESGDSQWLNISTDMDEYGECQDKVDRLIEWNVEVLHPLLKNIINHREDFAFGPPSDSGEIQSIASGRSCREPRRMPSAKRQNIRQQLRRYVERIAAMYKDLEFHNFTHASHVAQSANKLMNRILQPGEQLSFPSNLHEATFGISTDPLCQFVVVFAALIHDVDHTGVPNFQLVKENAQIAIKYNNKSVAERNSIDIALNILYEDGFEDLRSAIFASEIEEKRFRNLVMDIVLATDIFDKELQADRKQRWERAFPSAKHEYRSLKASIVLEHIIQASDVAHTMQHWCVFETWNQKLFDEMYNAYENGRSNKDPSEGWFESQISFFDNYVIPLARKLVECGVLGASSEEFLENACKNREEWLRQGKHVTQRMIEQKKKGPKKSSEDPCCSIPKEAIIFNRRRKFRSGLEQESCILGE